MSTPRMTRRIACGDGGGGGSFGLGERRVKASINRLGVDRAAGGGAATVGAVLPAVSSAPKRMRLVAPAGGVMKQVCLAGVGMFVDRGRVEEGGVHGRERGGEGVRGRCFLRKRSVLSRESRVWTPVPRL